VPGHQVSRDQPDRTCARRRVFLEVQHRDVVVPVTDRTPGDDVRRDVSLAIGEREGELQVPARLLFVVPVASEHVIYRVSASHDVHRVDEETSTGHVSSKEHPDHAKLKMVAHDILS
jgi:hypothetical protein